ncbi:hypothetical protein [Pedococcus soli]
MAQVNQIAATQTWVVDDGPSCVDPLEGHPGSFVQGCAALTDAELTELCRYWESRADLAEEDIDRWWCWTVVRFGRRLLASREEVRQRPRQWF